jgi:hypothetical protein
MTKFSWLRPLAALSVALLLTFSVVAPIGATQQTASATVGISVNIGESVSISTTATSANGAGTVIFVPNTGVPGQFGNGSGGGINFAVNTAWALSSGHASLKLTQALSTANFVSGSNNLTGAILTTNDMTFPTAANLNNGTGLTTMTSWTAFSGTTPITIWSVNSPAAGAGSWTDNMVYSINSVTQLTPGNYVNTLTFTITAA